MTRFAPPARGDKNDQAARSGDRRPVLRPPAAATPSDLPGTGDPAASWTTITDDRRYRQVFPFGGSGDRTPDPSRWFSIGDYNTDLAHYPLQALVHWRTGSRTGLHHLRLELGNVFKAALPNPCNVSVFLDNRPPDLFEFGGPDPPPIPTIGVAVKNAAATSRPSA